ncbi:NAD-dependent epimerase/dehydratase family protein [Parafilimonas terrae]|uniref:dTDP-L-rhamnose 4-epimerase n=1 Tax=Parafilimonas terrae TaxID=1465490 RepID=A0A1I5Z4Q3_9BACT|nr:NAD-dependent epimerase/dehydratase family protein [Parafilimonas terrae]SFQ51454.1 dTDP-L-rhamnose 4-epimerase [Parafilimonas terrae]
MNILITGGAGFIGSNLALGLIKKNYNVTVFDNLSKQIHGDNPYQSPLFLSIRDKVNFIEGDITNRTHLAAALKDQDVIIHYAAETGTGQSMYEIEKYCNVNINGTAILLDLITNNKNFKVKKIIVASSRSIYGEGKYRNINGEILYPDSRKEENLAIGDFNVKCPNTKTNAELMPTDENSRIHPSSIYGITKQNQEQMVLTVGKALNIPAIAFRYQNVYGPGQSLSNPYTGILSIFSTLIKNGKDINVFEDGKESRDFVFIDDVVNATILGVEDKELRWNSYNVGSGIATDVLTVANSLKRLYNSDVAVNVTGNYRLGDIRHNFADLTLIKKDLGFQPAFNFEKGIMLFVNWVNKQEVQVSRLEESLVEMKLKGLYK